MEKEIAHNHAWNNIRGRRKFWRDKIINFTKGSIYGYNDYMICPNDKLEMQTVQIKSFYGQPIFLEQCKGCGGIWFDQSELYRAKPGEAEKIELINADNLRNPTVFQAVDHFCPRDQTGLFKFTDPYFPREIVVERCPTCEGFWLNRGEFTRYQKMREEMMRPKAKTPEDIKLDADIKQVLELQQKDVVDSPLAKLAQFLNQPIDLAPGNFEAADQGNGTEQTFGGVLNLLTLILRLFIFKS
jgi:Zn-finger nucleic acid-binding protein